MSAKLFNTNNSQCQEVIHHILKAWLQWVDSGAPDLAEVNGVTMYRSVGICAIVDNAITHLVKGTFYRLECRDYFNESNGFDSVYPFGGCEVFTTEGDQRTMHLNPERVEWVRSTVAYMNEHGFLPGDK